MTQTSDKAREYSRANGERFLQELFEMLRIPSLSGDPAHQGDIQKMAEWLATHMSELGLEKVQIMPTAGHPVPIASSRSRTTRGIERPPRRPVAEPA